MFLLILVYKLINQLFQPHSNSHPTKRGRKTPVWPRISSRKARSVRVLAAQGRAVPGSRIPSVTGGGFPLLLSESLRVPPPPVGQRGHVRQVNSQKTLPVPPPALPVRSQPEVEHGTGVHQQRPAGEREGGRGWRGARRGDGDRGTGEKGRGRGMRTEKRVLGTVEGE